VSDVILVKLFIPVTLQQSAQFNSDSKISQRDCDNTIVDKAVCIIILINIVDEHSR
jgi:hypothetical protein